MVVIRLRRGGANKRPFFHVVVADSRRAASKKSIERLGFYDPKAPAGRESLRVNMERVKHWTGKGAQLSDTVRTLLKNHLTSPASAAEAASASARGASADKTAGKGASA